MRLLLVRHAESLGNAERRLQGRREFPLTARGVAQAQALAERLASMSIAAVYTSTVGRPMETAEIIAQSTSSSLPVWSSHATDRRSRTRSWGRIRTRR